MLINSNLASSCDMHCKCLKGELNLLYFLFKKEEEKTQCSGLVNTVLNTSLELTTFQNVTLTNQNTSLPNEDGSMESIENALFGEVGSQMKLTRGLWV